MLVNFGFLFVGFDLDVFVLDIQAKPSKCTHVEIGDPYKRESGDQITPPSAVEHCESGDCKKGRRNIVAEAIFTGQQIKKFASQESPAGTALSGAPVARFAKYFLVSNGP